MGTFKIKATTSPVQIAPNTMIWRRLRPGPIIDADVVAAINSSGGASGGLFAGTNTLGEHSIGNWSIRFNCFGASIELDGAGPLLDFNSLPSGFRATAAQLSLLISFGAIGTTNNRFLQHDVLSEQAFADANGTYTFLYDFSVTPKPSMLDIVNNGFGMRFAQTNDNGFLEFFSAVAASGFPITGTYILETFSWTVNQVGNDLQVASDGSTPDLTTVDKIIAAWDNGNFVVEIPKANFTTQNDNLIVTSFPETCSFSGTVQFLAQINGFNIVIGTIAV